MSLSLQAQNLGIKLADGTLPNTALDVNGGVSFREGTALTCVNGVNSNIALADYSFYRITGPTTAFSITGFGNGTDGRVLTVVNASGQNLTLSHQTTSTAVNQINTGGSAVVLPANGVATLIYNANLTKWIVSGTMGASPSFTSISNGLLSDSMMVVNNGVPSRVRPNDYIETYAWGLDGNSNITDGTHFLGTTNNVPLSIRVNNQKAGRIDHLTGNTTWGYQSGNVTTGINNTFSGHQTGIANTTGRDNTAFGYQALGTNTTAPNNTAIGSEALVSNTTGNDNVAIGRYSMRKNTTFYNNTAVGTYSLQENVGGYYNTAMGWSALNQNTSGFNNVGIGAQALLANTTGNSNVSIGMQSALL